MDEIEIYKNKAMRLEKALRKITDTRHRSYDSMLSIANYALEEEVRIEEMQANKACSGLAPAGASEDDVESGASH